MVPLSALAYGPPLRSRICPPSPLSSEVGTCKIRKVRFWPWLSGKSAEP